MDMAKEKVFRVRSFEPLVSGEEIYVHYRNCESISMKNIKIRKRRISTLQIGKIGLQRWLFFFHSLNLSST